jgi:hypothetical protein
LVANFTPKQYFCIKKYIPRQRRLLPVLQDMQKC